MDLLTGAPGNQDEKWQLQALGNELDAFSEELQRRPEVRTINKFAVVMAYIRIGLKGIGALMLLWATVVLLGGFVSDLTKKDFWYLTIIAFTQAAGLSDAMGNDRLMFLGEWSASIIVNTKSQEKRHHDERTHLPMKQWLKRQMHIPKLRIIDFTLALIFLTLANFAFYAPILCVTLLALRVAKQDYGIADGDASKANLKPALNLFYCASLAHSAISFLWVIIGEIVRQQFLHSLCEQHGFNRKVLSGYLGKTKQMCLDNPASTVSWNLITYGADLLDSQSLEEYALGGRVLTMLIDLDTPVPIAWLLNRSPRQRIQKLIRTLAWRSPAEKEMRWLAARIVEHLAGDLNLVHFPGALECIFSLFDTSSHNNADQEALHLTFVVDRSKQRQRKGSQNQNIAGNPWKDKDGNLNSMGAKVMTIFSGGAQQRGNCEDLVLAGLGILENLAHDRNNCALIYNTKDLISKVLAPISSNKLVEDIKSNAAWTKVVDGSLKVVKSLMGSSGSTGRKMRRLITNNINAVKNLEALLDMDMKSNCIIELQMQAINVLTELALHHPASISETKRRDKIIERALHIFLTTDWMEDYLKDEKMKLDNTLPRPSVRTYMNSVALTKEKNAKRAAEAHGEKKMKEAKETAGRLKEKAGEALAMLSSDSEAIKSFTACKDDEVCRLTELLDSKIKTIECKTSATDIVQIEINIGCRISAAVILKHLCNYVKEPTLRMVLKELLPIQAEASSTSTCLPRWWVHAIFCITAIRNDIENPRGGVEDEPLTLQSQDIQQCGERRLQAELLSLVTTIRANSNLDFVAILMSQTPPAALEDFVVRLKKMVEDNMYSTPACLAIQKLTCEMVLEFIQHDENVEVIDRHDIVGTLMEASEMMAGLESIMLLDGIDRDCHGVPLRPLSFVLAKNAQDFLAQRKQALGINIAPATATASTTP